MAKYADISYSRMLEQILKAAEDRFGLERGTDTYGAKAKSLPLDSTREAA